MATGRYTDVPRTTAGDYYPAQPVTVYEGGTSTLATLWQDDDGTVPESNPVRTAQTTGELTFVADIGEYDLLLPDGAFLTGVQIAGAGGGSDTVTSDDISDATTVGKAVLTAADAAAGRTALGAGTSSLTLGATSTTALAGNDSRLTAQAAGTASVRALAGGTAITASASDHTHTGLLTGSATAINNEGADFADLTAVTTAYNALLDALRGRGIIGGA